MNEKQIKEAIKVKEAELKALKDQLKALESTDKAHTITYTELSRMDSKSMEMELNKLDVKAIKKVAREGGVTLIRSSKGKCIEDFIEIVEARNNKGSVFR
ncbi:hypothetical protein [Clostridium sp.]|uniref:hypothetical protein n=1 Tax=Clostridium sp. TaxID=1506 RepID=UPI003F361F05